MGSAKELQSSGGRTLVLARLSDRRDRQQVWRPFPDVCTRTDLIRLDLAAAASCIAVGSYGHLS